jgi:hypothetical protein
MGRGALERPQGLISGKAVGTCPKNFWPGTRRSGPCPRASLFAGMARSYKRIIQIVGEITNRTANRYNAFQQFNAAKNRI